MQMIIKSGVLEVGALGIRQPEPEAPEPPQLPPARTPYFDVGDAAGSPGDTVEVSVEGGCIHPMDGFHIGGGVGLLPDVERAGYGKFRATGVELGDFLTDYLKGQEGFNQDGTPRFFSAFDFLDWADEEALPEEFWEYSVLFFSMEGRKQYEPVRIPGGTELFRLKIEILSTTPAAMYELTCKDEHYYTQSHQRRRDYTYTYKPQGFTAIDCFGGKLTVT